ncbi:hypothetical protein LINGRAHAP2_LOCUS7799 [Linum grandiflorum]
MTGSLPPPSTPLPSPSPPPSWSAIVGDHPADLLFVEKSLSSVFDGVLQIPQSVLDLGRKRLELAVVAHFAGSPPPLKVIAAMVNRLWSYGEQIHVSQLEPNFYLIELDSVATRDWVLHRSWHVHHSPMLLRCWSAGISPLAFSSSSTPVWITLRRVPPELLSVEGVSWLASHFGTPIHKIIRDELNVKVCVLRSSPDLETSYLTVNLRGGRTCCIQVVSHQPLRYRSERK